MIEAISTSRHPYLSSLIIFLLALPVTYFVVSYSYLVWWHKNCFLWDTVIHENGRLTLLGSLFYFDHFVGVVPMIAAFALCIGGGFALAGHVPPGIDPSRTAFVASVLLGSAGMLVSVGFVASIYTAGWDRTIDYALQRIERDGIMSKGGNWNQLQLSNIPISLGAIAVSSALLVFVKGSDVKGAVNLISGGITCISLAAALLVGISALNWPGWQSFLNPRWLAHSIREIATYPLAGIPIALAGVLLVENYLSGVNRWVIGPGPLSFVLIGMSILIVAGQLILLKNVDLLAMAQNPPFAPGGLSIPYLLFSHVFEHFLDFVLIGPLAGGIYALVRLLN